jgi:hypothetical protein
MRSWSVWMRSQIAPVRIATTRFLSSSVRERDRRRGHTKKYVNVWSYAYIKRTSDFTHIEGGNKSYIKTIHSREIHNIPCYTQASRNLIFFRVIYMRKSISIDPCLVLSPGRVRIHTRDTLLILYYAVLSFDSRPRSASVASSMRLGYSDSSSYGKMVFSKRRYTVSRVAMRLASTASTCFSTR